MDIDLEYAAKLTQRVISIDGVAHLQTLCDADVVDDVVLGVGALQVPIEIDDVMQEARLRACRAKQGVSTVYGAVNPVTGRINYSAAGKLIASNGTLGDRLRAKAAAASIADHPLNRLAWTADAAWTTGEAVFAGMARAAGGNRYIARVNGTCGATAPTGTTGAGVSDGAVAWIYAGPAQSANVEGAPAITITTTASGSGLTNIYYPALHPTRYQVKGATPEVYSTNFWRLKVFERKSDSSSPAYASGASVSFVVPAAKFCVAFSGPCNLEVDGRMIVPGAINHTSNRYVWVNFTAVGGLHQHEVTLHTSKDQCNFIGVWVDAYSQVWAPSEPDALRGAVIGDSIEAGSAYGPFIAGNVVAARIGKQIGIEDTWNFSSAGTGYINKNTSYLNFIERLPQVLATNPDILFPIGSINDSAQTGAAVTDAVNEFLDEARALGFSGPIVGIGVIPKNDGNALSTERAIAAAYAGRPECYWIPMYDDPSGPWITGTWNYGTQTTSTNATLYISDDNTHPTDLGSAYLADRAAAAIRKQVLPLIP